MREQFRIVKRNEECEKIFSGTYQGALSMSAAVVSEDAELIANFRTFMAYWERES